MIQLKKRTKDFLFSITKNCEALIKQTHKKPQEILELRNTKTFSFEPSNNLGLDSNWMIGLTSLEVYKSIFDKTEQNDKIELYTDIYNEFTFMGLKDELEEILNIEKITPEHLEDE